MKQITGIGKLLNKFKNSGFMQILSKKNNTAASTNKSDFKQMLGKMNSSTMDVNNQSIKSLKFLSQTNGKFSSNNPIASSANESVDDVLLDKNFVINPAIMTLGFNSNNQIKVNSNKNTDKNAKEIIDVKSNITKKENGKSTTSKNDSDVLKSNTVVDEMNATVYNFVNQNNNIENPAKSKNAKESDSLLESETTKDELKIKSDLNPEKGNQKSNSILSSKQQIQSTNTKVKSNSTIETKHNTVQFVQENNSIAEAKQSSANKSITSTNKSNKSADDNNAKVITSENKSNVTEQTVEIKFINSEKEISVEQKRTIAPKQSVKKEEQQKKQNSVSSIEKSLNTLKTDTSKIKIAQIESSIRANTNQPVITRHEQTVEKNDVPASITNKISDEKVDSLKKLQTDSISENKSVQSGNAENSVVVGKNLQDTKIHELFNSSSKNIVTDTETIENKSTILASDSESSLSTPDKSKSVIRNEKPLTRHEVKSEKLSNVIRNNTIESGQEISKQTNILSNINISNNTKTRPSSKTENQTNSNPSIAKNTESLVHKAGSKPVAPIVTNITFTEANVKESNSKDSMVESSNASKSRIINNNIESIKYYKSETASSLKNSQDNVANTEKVKIKNDSSPTDTKTIKDTTLSDTKTIKTDNEKSVVTTQKKIEQSGSVKESTLQSAQINKTETPLVDKQETIPDKIEKTVPNIKDNKSTIVTIDKTNKEPAVSETERKQNTGNQVKNVEQSHVVDVSNKSTVKIKSSPETLVSNSRQTIPATRVDTEIVKLTAKREMSLLKLETVKAELDIDVTDDTDTMQTERLQGNDSKNVIGKIKQFLVKANPVKSNGTEKQEMTEPKIEKELSIENKSSDKTLSSKTTSTQKSTIIENDKQIKTIQSSDTKQNVVEKTFQRSGSEQIQNTKTVPVSNNIEKGIQTPNTMKSTDFSKAENKIIHQQQIKKVDQKFVNEPEKISVQTASNMDNEKLNASFVSNEKSNDKFASDVQNRQFSVKQTKNELKSKVVDTRWSVNPKESKDTKIESNKKTLVADSHNTKVNAKTEEKKNINNTIKSDSKERNINFKVREESLAKTITANKSVSVNAQDNNSENVKVTVTDNSALNSKSKNTASLEMESKSQLLNQDQSKTEFIEQGNTTDKNIISQKFKINDNPEKFRESNVDHKVVQSESNKKSLDVISTANTVENHQDFSEEKETLQNTRSNSIPESKNRQTNNSVKIKNQTNNIEKIDKGVDTVKNEGPVSTTFVEKKQNVQVKSNNTDKTNQMGNTTTNIKENTDSGTTRDFKEQQQNLSEKNSQSKSPITASAAVNNNFQSQMNTTIVASRSEISYLALQIQEGFEQLAQNNDERLLLSTRTTELGLLKIELVKQENDVQVILKVQSEQSQKLLEQVLPELKQGLFKSNANIQDVRIIFTENREQDNLSRQHAFDRHKREQKQNKQNASSGISKTLLPDEKKSLYETVA